MKVLLAEDDPMLSEVIALSLKDAAFAVDCVIDGISALSAAQSGNYDVILLDLGLPRLDGMGVLKQLHERGNTALIIITARDDLSSRLAGLDGGADDYVIKPFEMRELLARIRAVMRRGQGNDETLTLNGLTLYPQQMQVRLIDGALISLSAKEFSLLHTLMRGAGKIFSRQQLEEKLYGWGEEVESNAIDFLIHALRKKLGKESIKNIRGAGWLMPKAHPYEENT